MSLAVTILGCGSSGGVPRVGQGWGACDPANPRNRRRRCSILATRTEGDARTNVLVDTSPDLREQLIDAKVDHLDAILFTHPHADHTHGVDDVRGLVLESGRRIPAYLDEPTAKMLTDRFDYIFKTPPGSYYPPLLDEHRIHLGREVTVEGPGGTIEAMPFRLDHGDMDALGFRIGGLAYTPDLNSVPKESFRHLEGLDVWIIDALRHKRHGTHLSVGEALEWVAHFKPRRAILTDLHVDLDYDVLAATLPENVTPAFDGMRIELA
ncbi:MBL fold metallo-hydrolase [Methylosinus sp. PW1]|uniref:MBL fold metallo-hydrolase n=1 Tax=Methylosinus sp. PW1 TaxID=107636 RepID=UPI00056CBC60|nr:MBL fold metallo-hydrolase [Methylosinus sp. PW1]